MTKVATILIHYHDIDDTCEGVEPFIVIVDNSQPNDIRLSDKYRDIEDIHLIGTEENLGFSNGNNLGINWAQGNFDHDFILILNNDTLIETDTIFKLTEAFSIDASIGISTCKIVYQSNPDIIWYGGAKMDYKKGWPRINDFNQKASDNGSNKSGYAEFASGCTMMFSNKSMKEIGVFEKKFFMYCEDLELSLRALSLGWKIYYDHRALVYHKVQGSSKNEDARVKRLHPKNPNAHFLFYHMKPNQYYTMKLYMTKEQFRSFKVNFWLRFIYFNLQMMAYGRFSILKTSMRTIRRINKLKR
jgi:GT2 family glycosyltransferase